jgi:ATP-dependent RNA helicase DDX10/DBP4
MAPHRSNGPPGTQKRPHTHPKSLKRKREEEGIESLVQRVEAFDATAPPSTFTDLPLSRATQSGLDASHFKTLTTIQAKSIPSSLKGGDILGAAKTGSGKTLAFLIPVLENLYRKQWTEYDGIGALILSPTRELAIQIFEVLRKVGRNHAFSAGLVIGGKSLQEERDRLARMNILVATPGRMLQHMDQTAQLEIGNLQILVLDEADRIMDMGFKETVDAIVEHLPKDKRQTMMFSATQTKRVSDLARLSLRDPEFVSVDEGAASATPSKLKQNYVVTPLPEKFDTLWSFIRANIKKKILVFLSSGKQVRFVYEAFRHLQPGISLLHVHGRQKQTARLDITTKFSASKSACLFATDVAARGLDFPAVDWVVQVDCPEDADTYIHRVGRTARYEAEGHAIMFLDPSEEEGALKALERKKIAIERINVRQKKMQNSIRNQLQNMCFKDPELKYLGQKAFVSYVKSVHLQKDKDIFDVHKLDLEQYAASMGLPGAPRVKFVKGDDAKTRKNAPRQRPDTSDEDEENGDPAEKVKPIVRTKYDRMFERRNQDVLADHYVKMIGSDDETGQPNNHADTDEDNDFLAVKRRFDAGDAALGDIASESSSGEEANQTITIPKHPVLPNGISPSQPAKKIKLSSNPSDAALKIDSKRREKLLKSKKKLLKFKGHGSHLHFDEEDQPYEKEYYEREEEFAKRAPAEEQRAAFLREEAERTKVADVADKALMKQKRKDKKEKRKVREREGDANGDDDAGGRGDERVAYLVPPSASEFPEIEVDDDSELEGSPPATSNNPKKKQPKKWFEDLSSSDDADAAPLVHGKKKEKTTSRRNQSKDSQNQSHNPAEPATLEGLEAMAEGLLRR